MEKVVSRDGTSIAYDRSGDGPPVILVDGAMCSRAMGPMPKLAARLAEHFTVIHYDRRGRGDSGDTKPYAVDREIEDLDALIKVAGGSTHVYGISSGAALALEAAHRGLAIKRLALYEPPFIVDDSRPPLPDDYVDQLGALIAADRRGDVVRLFMRAVEVPAFVIALMRFMPAWSKLKAASPTVMHDTLIVEAHQRGRPYPPGRWAHATVPTLVVAGGKSPAWMQHGTRTLAETLPNARHYTLERQTHIVSPKALAPVLGEFFSGAPVRLAQAG
jgi:pimeloyl-ACP methyl ester carboxylesterase